MPANDCEIIVKFDGGVTIQDRNGEKLEIWEAAQILS